MFFVFFSFYNFCACQVRQRLLQEWQAERQRREEEKEEEERQVIFFYSSTTFCRKKMPKIDTLDALEERKEHDDDYQANAN